MKLQLLQYINNCEPLPPISFNTDTTIGNKSDEIQDSLKVKIKTQPVEVNSNIVLPYVPFFNAEIN